MLRSVVVVWTSIAAVLALSCAACALRPGGHAAPAPPDAVVVGVRELPGAVDPLRQVRLPAAAFYPAPAADGAAPPTTTRGLYTLAAGADLPPAAGRHPLIVISHGHAGVMWGHHDLAEALARRGYVVAVLEHLGDRHGDDEDFASDRVMLGRAYQVRAVIDAVLADPVLAPHVDAARIGVAGFSAGGYTALLVIGARPDFGRMAGYCRAHPERDDFCGFTFQHDLAAAPPTVDPRVTAAFVMAPFALVFGADAFTTVTAPVFLAYAAEDRVLEPADNARAIAPALATRRGTRVVERAGHYVFLAPCSTALAAVIPALCTDPAGVDRVAVHRTLAEDAVAFFDHAWTSSAAR